MVFLAKKGTKKGAHVTEMDVLLGNGGTEFNSCLACWPALQLELLGNEVWEINIHLHSDWEQNLKNCSSHWEKKAKKKKLRETSALVQIKHFIVVPSVFILYKTISAFQNEKSF